MCGIAGAVSFDGRPLDAAVAAAMLQGIRHRGPDGTGVRAACPGVDFLHARLAVIDLSETANQPMTNGRCVAQGRARPLTVVFNGEIYNYRELRRDLESRGHQFDSHSDTEVLLHLYEEFGPSSVERLHGMFAFAIWDEARAGTFCARDRLGKKPFYYRYDGRTFWFASEPRAILLDPRVPGGISPAAIHSFLALGYVPGVHSAHAALQRLAPGHRVFANASGVQVECYWRLHYAPKLQISDAEAEAELESRLRASVKRRLISDVPVGAFLSGGLDSSIVVALMAEESASPVPTFSIGFDDAAFNELPLAGAVSRRYGTDHHEWIVRPDGGALLPRLAWHYGEPFADSSAVPSYELARVTRASISVVLNGDGGDENFAGYSRHWANTVAQRYQLVPRAVRSRLEKAATLVRASSSRTLAYDVERFLASASQPAPERYASWFGFFPQDALAHDFAAMVAPHDAIESLARAFADAEDLDPIDAALSVDVRTYLPDDLLVKVDIATMAHGLEARSPLLDHELMAFVARLPVRMKRRGRRGKQLLRRIAARLLPAEVVTAPKRGFGIPVDRWLRDDLRSMACDLLLPRTAEARNYVRGEVLERIMDEHMSGIRSHGQRIWALLMLELWHRECLKRN